MSADTSAAGGQLLPAADAAGGVIHNIGYRRYDGPRLGRAEIVRALTISSLRAAFGFGRGAKAKIFPVLLFAVMLLPAAVNAFAVAENPASGAIVGYDSYVPSLRTVALLVFVALEAPNLVSSDLRNHTLPLYFARPIKRIDYPVAKLIAFFLACLALIEIPLLVLYAGNVAVAKGGSKVWSQTTQLGPGLLYGAAWAILLAALGLLLASSTGKRVFAICAIGIPLFFTWILATVMSQIGAQAYGSFSAARPSALASLAGLFSPFTLLGGVLRWLGAAPAPNAPRAFQSTIIGSYGPLYGLVFLLLTIAAIAGLIARYRKVAVA